jgi:hypothetical protein
MRYVSCLTVSAMAGALVVPPAFAADVRAIANTDLNYKIEVPSTCRVEEGPGTLESICSPDLDAEKSKALPAASALLLELDAERVPADAKAAYGEPEFRQELPEAVCGEADNPKVKITDLARAADGDRVTWTATVVCPEITFLGLAERTASVRYVMSPAARYRLMARVPSADLAATKAVRDAFLASFAITPPKAP